MCKKLCIFFFLLSTYFYNNAQEVKAFEQIKTLIEKTNKIQKEHEKIKGYFDIADLYMDIEYYDSAQIWLNRISDIYLVNKASIFNYYLFSRKAEVHYYNNLNQLGITNANRGIEIAKKCNDPILLQDGYNLLGLMYLSMDSIEKAKNYFYLSIKNITTPPYPKKYLYQSMPHHIYGNMAEVFEKNNLLDSSYYYSQKSLEEAIKINNNRGISLAYNNVAKLYSKQLKIDSAISYFSRSDYYAALGHEYDVQLINTSNAAEMYVQVHQNLQAEQLLKKGMSLLDSVPNMNTFFRKEFLRSAKSTYEKLNNINKLQFVTDKLFKLEESINKRHFNQIQYILANSIKTESKFINANLEQEKKSKQLQINKLYVVILALIIIGILMFFYQYSVKEKLKLAILKNKISQDLHDDVGASLSSINMSASLAKKLIDIDIQKAKQTLLKISENAEDGISSLSDMVWAMKPVSSQTTTLESKIKNYGYNLLSVREIHCNYVIDKAIEEKLKNIEIRKNILLLIKEAFNNIAKHSKAKNAMLHLNLIAKKRIQLDIQDDGIGFELTNVQKGNGLQNMKRRVEELGGKLHFDSTPNQGTTIRIVINFSTP
ncbi:MAG: sensor histidine kinase [Chitinophagaceae bacterium]